MKKNLQVYVSIFYGKKYVFYIVDLLLEYCYIVCTRNE
jgi:hypothetical protein